MAYKNKEDRLAYHKEYFGVLRMKLNDITKRANTVLSMSEIYTLVPSKTDTIDELNKKTERIKIATKAYQELLKKLKNFNQEEGLDE